jgi:two-component system heavy metal sensor histidine kinase CusS
MLRATEALVTVSTGQNKSTYRVVVASNMEFHMNYMEDFEKTLWGIIFVSGLITIIVARFAVYRGHSPLRKLSRKIGSITADKLDIRLNPLEVPVELAGLVGSFNAMIERLEAGFEQLSYFSADIAHELRTPVTNLTTQTQVILNQPRTESEYVDILYSNLEEYERMTKMVSDMLLLAKTEHGLVKPQLERLNCRAELQELVEYFELLAEERQIQIRIRGADATIDCDRSMFRQAMSNLLSNAIRYSFENAIVKVAVSTNDEHTKITVSNPGPKISDDHLQRLFDRFFRADPSRKNHGQGVGLGLTIARSLLHMNGAKLTVSSDDNLTVFVVSFHK